MEGSRVRETFIEFFRKNGHQYVRSSSLVPFDDPTLLFANAGMNQFKDIFTGVLEAPYKSACSHQKCVRAGGKHNDFETVGHSKRHHTFFEMLGNFSFGGYFKEEAIDLAWKLCIDGYGIDPSGVWITVFEEDDDAHALWRDRIGIPGERIVRLGAKDNFWAMGDTGPCGPCSELFMDNGPGVGCGRPDCDPGCDCGRFVEFWNLVFMEFERNEQGEKTPLPRPCIDTGMGLERMAAVLQGVDSNYKTDLFTTLISSISEHLEQEYGVAEAHDVSFRVIADHLRALTFLVSDGVLPSNEGRGYVLRKIIRRAVRHGKILGAKKPFLYSLTGVVADQMSDAYPDLNESRTFVAQVAVSEEERFERTLSNGMRLMNELIGELTRSGETVIPGEEAFKLYDTFGFPRDLIDEIANDSSMTVDGEGFAAALGRQQKRSAAAAKETEARGANLLRICADQPPTQFLGYESTTARDCRVLLLLDGEETKTDGLDEGDSGLLLLDRSPFYGEAGGQMGDTGRMEGDNCLLAVTDVQRSGDYLLHAVTVREGSCGTGDRLRCRVDEPRRLDIMANHTATHLLQAALRSVVGDHVKQAGSMVAPDRLRFDFTHFSSIDDRDLKAIEETVNQVVRQNLDVSYSTMPIEEAMSGGAIALFGEKYGDEVRVVAVEGFSRELCGGTHCERTGQIGLFKVLSEKSIASGVRRMEAVTGRRALEYFQQQQQLLQDVSQAVKSSPGQVLEDVGRIQTQVKQQAREIEKLRMQLASRPSGTGGGAGDGVTEVEGVRLLVKRADDLNPSEMRNLADTLGGQVGSGIVVLAGRSGEKVALLVAVSKDLTDRISAVSIIKAISPIIGGGGGGRPDMAQAGGKRAEALPELLEKAPEAIAGQLRGEA